MTTPRRRTGPAVRAATLLLMVCILSVTAAPAAAQSPATGVLAGVVTEAGGEPLSDALVTMTSAGTGLSRQATTDRDGSYRFAFAQPGEYHLFIERIGYTPAQVEGVRLGAGGNVRLVTTLASSGGAAMTVDTMMLALPPATGFGTAEQVAAAAYRTPATSAPALRHALPDLAVRSSRMAGDGAADGLPGSFSAVTVDGTVFRPARHPLFPAGGLATSPLPLQGIATADVVSSATDVEWGRAGGAFLTTTSRTGGTSPVLEGQASFGSGAISPSGAIDGGSGTSLLGSVAWSGPVLGDSARAAVGVTFRRLEMPMTAAWNGSDAGIPLTEAYNGDVGAHASPEPAPENAVAGFASFDWRINASHALSGSLHLGSATTVPAAGGAAVAPGAGSIAGSGLAAGAYGSGLFTGGTFAASSATDLVGGTALRSRLSRSMDNELRVSYTWSERDTDVASTLPATYLAFDGLALGGNNSAARSSESVVTVSDALHLQRGAVSGKLGVELSRSSHTHEYRAGAGGRYWYGSAADLLAGNGAFMRTEGAAGRAAWGTPRPAGFIQAVINAGGGLEVLLGGRAERETLPDDVRPDTAWLRLTGISNAGAPASDWLLSPRVGMRWDVQQDGRFIVSAAGGLWYDRVDPLLLAEWQMDNGAATVRRAVGDVTWAEPGTIGGTTATRLTVLAPGFVPPRTTRAAGGISYAASPVTTVSLGGTARRTVNLPRRRDLNLLPVPATRDQYGSGVFGTLVQHGGLVVAEPGSSRSFDTYDEVAGITGDGWSEHWGIDVGVEHEIITALAITGRYSFSDTRDNWMGARSGGWTVAPPRGFEGSAGWVDGTSDFDVPHRLVTAATYTAPGGILVQGLYRFESGLPFTPGFRAGVDADGDGFAGNEAAFVDPDLPGMAEIIADWSCLGTAAGRVIGRNTCRTDAVHSLDLGVGMEVFRRGGRSAAVRLELFDLLESRHRAPDTALYLIDPDGDLVHDTAARTVHLPLMANPDFGQPLPQRHAGRMLRLGVALNW